MLSGEKVTIPIPCNDKLIVTWKNFDCIEDSVLITYRLEFAETGEVPILDGMVPHVIIINETTNESVIRPASANGEYITVDAYNLPDGDYLAWTYEIFFEDDYGLDAEGIKIINDSDLLFSIPCDTQTDIVIEDEQDDNTQQDDNSVSTGQCTPDPFGYGKINVLNSWGSYSTLPENSGYEIFWGWSFAYENSQYSTDGLYVNFDPQGPFPYAVDSWTYAYDSKVDLAGWTDTPGTYTFTIVDFENQGAYCGDGNVISITIP